MRLVKAYRHVALRVVTTTTRRLNGLVHRKQDLRRVLEERTDGEVFVVLEGQCREREVGAFDCVALFVGTRQSLVVVHHLRCQLDGERSPSSTHERL